MLQEFAAFNATLTTTQQELRSPASKTLTYILGYTKYRNPITVNIFSAI